MSYMLIILLILHKSHILYYIIKNRVVSEAKALSLQCHSKKQQVEQSVQ